MKPRHPLKALRFAKALGKVRLSQTKRLQLFGEVILTADTVITEFMSKHWSLALQCPDFMDAFLSLMGEVFTQCAIEDCENTKHSVILKMPGLPNDSPVKINDRGAKQCPEMRTTLGEADHMILNFISTGKWTNYVVEGNDWDHNVNITGLFDSAPNLMQGKQVVVERGGADNDIFDVNAFVSWANCVHPALSRLKKPLLCLQYLFYVTGSDNVSGIKHISKITALHLFVENIEWINGWLSPEEGQLGANEELVDMDAENRVTVSSDAAFRLFLVLYWIPAFWSGGKATKRAIQQVVILMLDRTEWPEWLRKKVSSKQQMWGNHAGSNKDGSIKTLKDLASLVRCVGEVSSKMGSSLAMFR